MGRCLLKSYDARFVCSIKKSKAERVVVTQKYKTENKEMQTSEKDKHMHVMEVYKVKRRFLRQRAPQSNFGWVATTLRLIRGVRRILDPVVSPG
jgi:hypothetical protein